MQNTIEKAKEDESPIRMLGFENESACILDGRKLEFDQVQFVKCQLAESNFEAAEFIGVTFDGCNLSNCHFIFSGSEQHLLSEMFQSHNRPFYNSTTIMHLGRIDINVYRDFAQYWFIQGHKQIEAQTFDDLYNAFDGNTFCLQKILHMAYDTINPNETCDKSTLQSCLHNVLEENSHGYKEILSRMTNKQKSVLVAIAIDGKAIKVTSGAFLRKHNLESASMVQTALRYLLEAEWVTVREQTYFVSDAFFSMWLRQL